MRTIPRLLPLSALLISLLPSATFADPPEAEPAYQPKIEAASDEAERAIRRFRVPEGLSVELFAAEPLLAHPVAFWIDETGRVYVAETFRHSDGVTDDRGHMNWLDADLAARTVEDRVAMYREYLGEEEFRKFGVEHDRIRLVEDRDGDGRADHATVFADGFHDPADGLGAGVLARGGEVWYTCIPDLWRLRDDDGDGKADVRESLHHGYGVHVAFLGHDLHGLRFGPDGRLYFSVGDRGLNVATKEGTRLEWQDTGTVLRCEPDGTNLEVVASGLRNPQELAFDEFGNLFTVDNNSDGGDRARLVHLVEGGDSGWRIGYQFIERPNGRGPWNAEKLWHPEPDNTARYLLPPLANLSDGPSGLAYDPGTGLPERYRHHFFLADFRGSTGNSGVRSFTVRPRGASFEMAAQDEFLWGLEATDVDFGPDGALYVSDWGEGWNKTGKGRIYKVFDPSAASSAVVREVRSLLAEGMSGKSLDELGTLLGHADMRIRQEAQFELARRAIEESKDHEASSGPISALEEAARGEGPLLARLHAIWGIGQVTRASGSSPHVLISLLNDGEAEVRAQAAHVIGDVLRSREDMRTDQVGDAFRSLLGDESPRVRFFAALALGKLGRPDDIGPVLALLRENADRDAYLRHAGVMALTGIDDVPALVAAANDESSSVRLGILLALRRLGSPEIARFLGDGDPSLALEAARAIYDVPIEPALPALAALEAKGDLPEPLQRRIVAANQRLGGPVGARALAEMAARPDLPEPIRVEALGALADWEHPNGRDRIVGLWRPIDSRPVGPAAEALRTVLASLLRDAPDPVRQAATRSAGRLGLGEAGDELLALLNDPGRPVETRIEALKTLERLGDARLDETARRALDDRDGRLRVEGLRVLARLHPEEVVPRLDDLLEHGAMAERQGAFSILGTLESDSADALLARWLDRLNAGDVAPEVRLDLLSAARARGSDALRDRVAAYESQRPSDDPLAPHRDALQGGDASRGESIFREKAEVSCLRCHAISGQGGAVGPDLAGIGGKQTREYLLESIVAPSRQIAEGFETVVVATDDGRVIAGVLKSDEGEELKLMTPEAELVTIPKGRITDRAGGDSAMPADVIQNLSPFELRDLLEFLSSLRP